MSERSGKRLKESARPLPGEERGSGEDEAESGSPPRAYSERLESESRSGSASGAASARGSGAPQKA